MKNLCTHLQCVCASEISSQLKKKVKGSKERIGAILVDLEGFLQELLIARDINQSVNNKIQKCGCDVIPVGESK